jgi:hypothetical protein
LIKDSTQNRQIRIGAQIGDLSHERLQHQRRVEEIDKTLLILEGKYVELEQVKRDLDTEEAIQKAKNTEPKKEA